MPVRIRWVALGAVGITAIAIIVIFVLMSGDDGEGTPDAAASPTPSSADGDFVALTPFQARVLGFDVLDEVNLPQDNPFSEAKVELGRLLFFDPRLSANSAISCASCHQPDQGWTDGLPLSFGYAGSVHWRNTPTIINSAFHPKLDWDGKALRLDIQAQGAMKGAVAMNMDPVMVEERLRQIPEYVQRFDDVFGPGGPWFEDASRAIAGCSACHRGRLFTDEDFHGLGVPTPEEFSTDAIRQITFNYQLHSRGVSEEVYRTATDDPGLYLVTKVNTDFGQFRTPMLRELGQTAPYMHNGAFATLEQVIEFYNVGGGESPNLDPLLRPLGLTDQNKSDLIAFLNSLTGDPIVVEEPQLPSYEVIK